MTRFAAAFLATCLFVAHASAQPAPTAPAAAKTLEAALDAFIAQGMAVRGDRNPDVTIA